MAARYEIFDANAQFGTRVYGTGNAQLGARSVTLLESFAGSPITNGSYTIDDAKKYFETYDPAKLASDGFGINDMFPMYRRNFNPDPAAGNIYDNPREKHTTPTGPAGLPATPYSPNVAVPGVAGLTSPSDITRVSTGTIPLATNQQPTDPNDSSYQNLDSTNHIDNIGSARRFRLGVGSTYGKNRTETTR